VINVAKDWPKFEDENRKCFAIGLLDEPHARLDHAITPILQGFFILVFVPVVLIKKE
jgi:hypothetical protein